MKTKLIGSAPSCNELRALVEKNWHWTGVVFDLVTGQVFVNEKPIDGLRVIKRAGRFRLERILEV